MFAVGDKVRSTYPDWGHYQTVGTVTTVWSNDDDLVQVKWDDGSGTDTVYVDELVPVAQSGIHRAFTVMLTEDERCEVLDALLALADSDRPDTEVLRALAIRFQRPALMF